MNASRPPTSEDFAAVANWSRQYFELMHANDVGRAFSELLQELARLAAVPRDGVDRFDALKEGELRVRAWLERLAAAQQLDQQRRQRETRTAQGRSELPPPGTGTLLFVYGTLKRGHRRHSALATQTFLGPATTQPLYRMYDCGGYPGLVKSEAGRAIEGELWHVQPDGLEVLDEIEGVDTHLYRRRQVQLEPPHDQQEIESYFYVRSVHGLSDAGTCWGPPGPPPVPSQDQSPESD